VLFLLCRPALAIKQLAPRRAAMPPSAAALALKERGNGCFARKQFAEVRCAAQGVRA
jgi:hypothetical protein